MTLSKDFSPTHRFTVTPIRILFLLDKLASAGTQNNLLQIVSRLDRARFEPHVIALLEGGVLEKDFRKAAASVLVLKTGSLASVSAYQSYRQLVRFMKDRRIDLVQTHFLHADVLGSLAARKTGAKVLMARRDEGFWRSGRELAINRFFNRYAVKILANSQAVANAVEKLEKVEPLKVEVIYNGVELGQVSEEERNQTRQSLGLEKDDIAVCMAANMRHAIKGHKSLLDALKIVRLKNQKVKLLLAGDGVLRKDYESYARVLGISQAVLFLGIRQDIGALLNASDIACLSSTTEGFSNAVLEYMAYAKPVVATDVGGNPEMVTEETGFLVPPEKPQAFAEKLLLLAENPMLRKEMGEAGRRNAAEKFSFDSMVKGYQEIYQKTARVKVLYVIWSLDLGGAEQVVLNLAKGLDCARFEPVICCLNEKGRYAGEAEKQGIRVEALHKKLGADIGLVFRLADFMRKEKIELVHTHLFTSNLWGRIAAKIAGVPAVITEHNMDVWKKPLHFALDKLLVLVSRRMIFVSKNAENFYREHLGNLKSKPVVVYNGIDTQKFSANGYDHAALKKSYGIAADSKVLGIVGRLVPQKGHEDFLETIRILKAKGQKVVGLIVGDGELRKTLEVSAVEKGISEQTVFLGFRDDLERIYHAMDILVLSSSREGFPMTILEAMASGVPVAATEVGGVGECLINEEDGFLVPAGNPEKMAEAVLKLLTDKNLYQKITQNAGVKVRGRFSIQHMVREHETLYHEVLKK